MEAYSVTIAKNHCLDRLKSKQAQVLSFDDSIAVQKTVSMQKEIEVKDELRWVSNLIDQLPERERMIIQLREIEHYDFNQIATILEIPEGTVRVYLSRIRKKLKTQFLEIQNHGL
jgi:RNA polymerase sigma-70 factor (ECF subfamily)